MVRYKINNKILFIIYTMITLDNKAFLCKQNITNVDVVGIIVIGTNHNVNQHIDHNINFILTFQ